ncbi:RICIN domain-containing protein [Streptomyces abikoensis]|uniref:RICIN domain-containing protein n=1 Tax=Streptomyces abikoensis TaxID=97398 RepID=UPI0016766BF2|nr:RICIN domain-containing protein [Streptomyces abikoensis]
MSRITRVALAIGAGVAALAGSVTPASADEAPRAAAPSAVQLKLEHSGKCLTIPNASFRNGVDAVQSTCVDGAENQLFDVVSAGSATFELRAKHSGKCLDAESAGVKPGTVVQQWWCVDAAPQERWRLVMVDVVNELYELRPAHALDKNLCLDISGASKDDGAIAQLWTCNGSGAQKWRLQPAKSA